MHKLDIFFYINIIFNLFFVFRVVDGDGPVHITISEPSPEGRPSATLLPLHLQDDGGGGDPATASDRNRKHQQQQHHLQQQHAANVSITITDASPDGAYCPKPLPAATTVASTVASQTAHTKRLAFRRASEAKIIQHKALVHRTSEGPHS